MEQTIHDPEGYEIDLTLRIALENHLRYNHYPPLPLSFVPVCAMAIDLVNMEELDELIQLPENIEVNDKSFISACDVVDFCHLEYFLNQEEE